jgi:hypothetical protein
VKATFIINQLTFELAAETSRDLFMQVAQIQDIFEAETKCGCCQSESIRYGYREVDSYKFYELTCRDCTAQFKFGQRKQTNELFPKRKDEAGNPLPNGGWAKYERHASNDEEAPPQRSAPRPASQPAAKTNGDVPHFKTWHDAEHSQHWGEKYLKIDEAKGLVKLADDGSKYVAENKPAVPARS